jgi:hypothetical protein
MKMIFSVNKKSNVENKKIVIEKPVKSLFWEYSMLSKVMKTKECITCNKIK